MICRAVADAVVDLAEQNLAFGGKRGKAVTRGMDFRFRLLVGLLDFGLAQRSGDGRRSAGG